MKVPCKDCEKRKLGCHSKCDRYKKFNETMKQIRKARFDENEETTDYMKIVKHWR